MVIEKRPKKKVGFGSLRYADSCTPNHPFWERPCSETQNANAVPAWHLTPNVVALIIRIEST